MLSDPHEDLVWLELQAQQQKFFKEIRNLSQNPLLSEVRSGISAKWEQQSIIVCHRFSQRSSSTVKCCAS